MRGKNCATQQPTDRSPLVRSDEGKSHRKPIPPAPPTTATPHQAAGARSRFTAALAATPVRLTVATGLACCLGLVALAESRAAGTAPPEPATTDALRDRAAVAAEQPASRDQRAARPTSTPSPGPTRTTPARPRPVAGLNQLQMDNAQTIVQVGLRLKVPRRGLVIAVATAMQESNLHNLASGVLPESRRYPHQGVGWDHDSVGLFQQRSSSGWGSVRDLMRPSYAAEKFYRALLKVSGWQALSLTAAAQAVQRSAYPYAYAKHEERAERIVAALAS